MNFFTDMEQFLSKKQLSFHQFVLFGLFSFFAFFFSLLSVHSSYPLCLHQLTFPLSILPFRIYETALQLQLRTKYIITQEIPLFKTLRQGKLSTGEPPDSKCQTFYVHYRFYIQLPTIILHLQINRRDAGFAVSFVLLLQ